MGITEQLQELIEKRDVSVQVAGATVTLSPRNLDENEFGMTLRLPSSAEPRSEYRFFHTVDNPQVSLPPAY